VRAAGAWNAISSFSHHDDVLGSFDAGAGERFRLRDGKKPSLML
jgi:hypothetical protein